MVHRVATLFAFAAVGSFCSAQNLIFNGDFTQGEVGFTGSPNHAVTTNPSLVNPSAVSFLDHTGNSTGPRNMLYAMPTDISQQATSPIWNQQVTVTAGVAYDWNVWVAKTVNAPYTSGVELRFLQPDGGGAARFFGVEVPSGQWNLATVRITPINSGTVNLYIKAIGDPGVTHDLALDDISFTATSVPEPATIAVLLMGAGLVLRRRRRS